MPRISLVIPAFNPAFDEEEFLPALLDTVDRARAKYSGGPSARDHHVAPRAAGPSFQAPLHHSTRCDSSDLHDLSDLYDLARPGPT